MSNQTEPMTQNPKDALDDFPNFKRDADELESWMLKKQEEISNLMNSDRSLRNSACLEQLMKTLSSIERELAERAKDLITLATNPQHVPNRDVNKRKEELLTLWTSLKSSASAKRSKLEQHAKEMEEYNRLCDDVVSWIQKKKALVYIMIDEDDQPDSRWERDFAEIKEEVNSEGNRVTELSDTATTLLVQKHPDNAAILRRRSEVDYHWEQLRRLVDVATRKPTEAEKVEKYDLELFETLAQLQGSDAVLSDNEVCKDVADVERLQRALDATERDLAALEPKIMSLSHEARLFESTLMVERFQLTIQSRRAELLHKWLELNTRAKRRRKYLERLHHLHRLLAECKTFEAWMRGMRASILEEVLPEDVEEAMALEERHQERKVQLDARIKAFALAKANAVDGEFHALPEAYRRLTSLDQLTESVLELWQNKRRLYEYSVVLQKVFAALAQMQSIFDQNLKRNDREVDGSLISIKYNIEKLCKTANSLVESGDLAVEDMVKYQQKLDHKYENLKTQAIPFKALMKLKKDSHALIMWIEEKLKYAKDESYDVKKLPYPPALNCKLQEQRDFEQELKEHEPRVMELLSRKYECPAQINEIAELWESLKTASELKATRLRELDQKRRYYWVVEDVERQLSEVEAALSGEDCGEEPNQRGDVNERYDTINSILTRTDERIEAYAHTVRRLVEEGHRDAVEIEQKQEQLQLRHRNLQRLMPAYLKWQNGNGERFNDEKWNEFLLNLNAEDEWIEQTERYVKSLCDSDMGRDLFQLQKQLKEHRELLAEIDDHEAQYSKLRETGAYFIGLDSDIRKGGAEVLSRRVANFYERLGKLKMKFRRRVDILEDSYRCLRYFDDATQSEDWLSAMSQKFPRVTDCSEDEDGSTALLAKHADNVNLYKEYASRIASLREQVRACREKRVHHETPKFDSWAHPVMTKPVNLIHLGLIDVRQSEIEDQYEMLFTLAKQRRDEVEKALQLRKGTRKQNVDRENQSQNVDYENQQQKVDHQNQQQKVDYENRQQNFDHENQPHKIDRENKQQKDSEILQEENVDEVQQQNKVYALQVPKDIGEDLQAKNVCGRPADVEESIIPDNFPIVGHQGDDVFGLEILSTDAQTNQVDDLEEDEPLDQPFSRDCELTENEMPSSLNVDESTVQESPTQSCSCPIVSHDSMRQLTKHAEMVTKRIAVKLQLESDDIISNINDSKDAVDSNLEECQILQVERARALVERWRAQTSNEIAEVESWVEERIKRLAGSDDCGSDLASVQSLRNSHKDLEAELQNYEPNVRTILEAGETLPDDEKPDVEPRLELLQQAWSRLQELATTRRRKLDESLVRQLDSLSKDDEKDESDEDTSDAVRSILDEYNAAFEATTSSLL